MPIIAESVFTIRCKPEERKVMMNLFNIFCYNLQYKSNKQLCSIISNNISRQYAVKNEL